MARAPTLEQRICIHEAGHAAGSRLVGLSCGGAFLSPPHTDFDCDCGARSIVALMAGAVAECIHFGDYDATGITVDWRLASQRLDALGYGDGGASLWDYTLNLLHPYRGLIRYVAVRLERHRMLTGEQLDRLLLRG